MVKKLLAKEISKMDPGHPVSAPGSLHMLIKLDFPSSDHSDTL